MRIAYYLYYVGIMKKISIVGWVLCIMLSQTVYSDEIKVSSVEELNELIPKETEVRITILNEKYEKLQTEIDTYEKYMQNKEQVEAFYTWVCQNTKDICIRMRECCLRYADVILKSNKSNDEKYDDLEDMYDVVYDEAGEEIYDEYYDGVLDDVYDVFYDGILEDAYDTADYGE